MPNPIGGEAVPVYQVQYLETCLPDYFRGYAGQVFTVPLPKRPRASDVLKGLLDEINNCEIFPEPVTEEAYDQLRVSAMALFQGMDMRTSWSYVSDDLSDSYAHFGVVAP